MLVPNQFPTLSGPHRIAIIGEAPGEQEESTGLPFVGQSGKLLDRLLSNAGIIRASCFVGNICQVRPPKNDISQFEKEGPEITEGRAQLARDLEVYKPNLCLLLGRTALWAFKGIWNISDWRGSVFATPEGQKCLATYHPALVLRQYSFNPLVQFDILRAAKEGQFPDVRRPVRNLRINLSFGETVYALTKILEEKPAIASDIEGGVSGISCISFARSPTESFTVPFTRLDGSSYWTFKEEVVLWWLVARIMAEAAIRKTWQNGLYDRFVLQWTMQILVRGSSEDTMLKHWELYAELEKSLAVQTSIYTDEPYYKADRKSTDQDTAYRYCCMDSAVTQEISDKLSRFLQPAQLEHYRFNLEALNVLLYAELRGMRYDTELAQSRLIEMRDHVYRAQEALDRQATSDGALAGLNFEATREELITQVNSICGRKKDPAQPKKDFVTRGYWIAKALLDDSAPLSPVQRGFISMVCKATLNTKSHKKFQDYLYKTCALPVQWKKDPATKEMRPTTNYEALLKLSKNHAHPALSLALSLSRLRTRCQMLAIQPLGGRMYCNYNLVGSETGRVTSSKSNLHSAVNGKAIRVGTNMQTIPDDWDTEDELDPIAQGMRDLFIADEGCYLGKCDLKGADGWTIGAYMAMLGDPTMLDDLRFGLKPAQFPAYILKYGAKDIEREWNNRAALKELFKRINKDDWEYFVSKQGIWGSCYLMGPRKLAETIFIQSEGKVNLSERDATNFQKAIFLRYKVQRLHNWMADHLAKQRYPAKLIAPTGSIRKFFGRREEILGEALAHLPQVVTTYATIKAAHRLWTDPENRQEKSLRVEPLHQVHDELVVQWRIEDTTWAIGKIKQWFNNEIVVAGQRIVIPYSGAYGTAWSMDKDHYIGEV